MKFLLVIFLFFSVVGAYHFDWNGNTYWVSSYRDDEVLIHIGGYIPAYLDILQQFFLKEFGDTFYNIGSEHVQANFAIEDSVLYLKEIYAFCVGFGLKTVKDSTIPPSVFGLGTKDKVRAYWYYSGLEISDSEIRVP